MAEERGDRAREKAKKRWLRHKKIGRLGIDIGFDCDRAHFAIAEAKLEWGFGGRV